MDNQDSCAMCEHLTFYNTLKLICSWFKESFVSGRHKQWSKSKELPSTCLDTILLCRPVILFASMINQMVSLVKPKFKNSKYPTILFGLILHLDIPLPHYLTRRALRDQERWTDTDCEVTLHVDNTQSRWIIFFHCHLLDFKIYGIYDTKAKYPISQY